jgi:hypothetical protein
MVPRLSAGTEQQSLDALAEGHVNMSGGRAWCAWPLVLYEEMEELSGPPESPCGRRLQTTYRGLG